MKEEFVVSVQRRTQPEVPKGRNDGELRVELQDGADTLFATTALVGFAHSHLDLSYAQD